MQHYVDNVESHSNFVRRELHFIWQLSHTWVLQWDAFADDAHESETILICKSSNSTEVSCQIAGRQQQRHDTVCFHNGNVPKCDISEPVEKIRSPFYRADGTGCEWSGNFDGCENYLSFHMHTLTVWGLVTSPVLKLFLECTRGASHF